MNTKYAIIKIGFILVVGTVSLIFAENNNTESIEAAQEAKIDTFTFSANGTDTKGKIFLPASYETNKNLPAIFLIDFTEQHFTIARDEFEKVIEGVQQIEGFDALVVSLENIPNIDASPGAFKDHYEIYKNMASYVDGRYTNNTSRTFIGRGSESGIVLMACFLDSSETQVFENFIATDASDTYKSRIISTINNNNVAKDKLNSKLHFSFSSSNNRANCINLINTINEAQYPWLQFESIEYANSTYPNTYPVAFAAGLKYVFSDLQTGLEEKLSPVPGEYQLEQNYPNPFNPSTTISFSLPQASAVNLSLYNLRGQLVRTLVSSTIEAGHHTAVWDGRNERGERTSSGIFIYRLQTGDFIQTKKMIMVK